MKIEIKKIHRPAPLQFREPDGDVFVCVNNIQTTAEKRKQNMLRVKLAMQSGWERDNVSASAGHSDTIELYTHIYMCIDCINTQ